MSTYPGVYILEKSALSLGTAGMSGLLPLLVGRFKNKDGSDGSDVFMQGGITYIANYTEFADRFMSTPIILKVTAAGAVYVPPEQGEDSDLDKTEAKPKAKKAAAKSAKNDAAESEVGEISDEVVAATIPLTVANLNLAALALSNYFNNGGGACYLLSVGEDDSATWVAKQIEQYSELSLLAVIDSDTSSSAAITKTKEINDALATFITTNPQSFLLASTPANAVKTTYLNPQHVALYTPDLRLSSSPALYDEGILVNTATSGDAVFMPLSDLQSSDNDTYTAVKKALAATLIDYDAVTNPIISPVAAVAGAYCTTERTRGIWKAPANISLIGVSPTVAIDKKLHGDLNALGINAIIWQPSKGTSIMGARTLEDAAKTAWRYVPVRLLFNTVERDIRSMLSPVVFEPNSAPTWQSVTAAINNYLYKLWKKGGLYGKTPEEAYRVALALEDDDIDNGILRVRVGLAALRPVEFIYLEFTQDLPVTS